MWRWLFPIICQIILLLNSVSLVAKNFDVITDSIEITPFQQIMLIGTENTIFTLCQSSSYALSLKGCSRDEIILEKSDSTLMVFVDRSVGSSDIVISIHAPEWHSILCALANKIRFGNKLISENLRIEVNAVNSCDIDVQSGVFQLELRDVDHGIVCGNCDKAMVVFDSSPEDSASVLDARNLCVKQMLVDTGIQNNVYMHVEESLWIQNGRDSEITIYGSPRTIHNDTPTNTVHFIPVKK